MAKTAPIVIPLTVDTTGVDRGLSNVRSRLSRGGGRGTGSGFGTGGNNAYGVGNGGQGGVGIGGAIAAGVVAGRISRGGKQTLPPRFERVMFEEGTTETRRDIIKAQFRAGIRAKETRDAQKRFYTAVAQLQRRRVLRTSIDMEDQLEFEQAQTDVANTGREFVGLRERERSLQRAVNRGIIKRRFGRLESYQGFIREGSKYALGRLGVPEFAAGRIAAGLGSVGGLAVGGVGAAVGVGALAANFRQRQAQMFSNFSQYEGTPFYGIARAQARRFGKEDQISWWDRMWLREAESGGALSKTLNFIGYLFGKGAEGFGYMVGQGDPFQMQSSSRTLANVLYGRTVRAAN